MSLETSDNSLEATVKNTVARSRKSEYLTQTWSDFLLRTNEYLNRLEEFLFLRRGEAHSDPISILSENVHSTRFGAKKFILCE